MVKELTLTTSVPDCTAKVSCGCVCGLSDHHQLTRQVGGAEGGRRRWHRVAIESRRLPSPRNPSQRYFSVLYEGSKAIKDYHLQVNKDANAAVEPWRDGKRTVSFSMPANMPDALKYLIGEWTPGVLKGAATCCCLVLFMQIAGLIACKCTDASHPVWLSLVTA